MLTAEDIKTIADLMNESLKPIHERLDKVDQRLDSMEEQLEAIKEDTEITRTTTNEVVEWIDENFRKKLPFPVGTAPRAANND